MSDGARKGPVGQPPPQDIDPSTAESQLMPRKLTPNQLFGSGRGEPVAEERKAAASQIQRTLRVWRKSSADAGKPADETKGHDDGDSDKDAAAEKDEGEDKEAGEAKDAAEGKEAGEAKDAGGDKSPEAGEEKAPEIGAKLEGVGRKIFLARDKGEPTYTKKQCQTSIKILEQFDRLAQKFGLNLGEKRLKDLTTKRDAGTITGQDLPSTLREKYDLPLDMPLSQIREMEQQAK